MALPYDESGRLAELRRLLILDSGAERAYDDITRHASEVFGMPMSFISLVDEDRQWFKSKVGSDAVEMPRSWSFCSHTIQDPEHVLVINDAQQDSRFKDNPLVTGNPHVRFYAGAPLVTPSGHAIGSLCVMDSRPREVDPAKLQELQFLASQVVAMMEKRAEFGGLFGEGSDGEPKPGA